MEEAFYEVVIQLPAHARAAACAAYEKAKCLANVHLIIMNCKDEVAEAKNEATSDQASRVAPTKQHHIWPQQLLS